MTTLVKNIGILETPSGFAAVGGKAQGETKKLRNAAVLIEDGLISGVYENGELPADAADSVLDACGALVTPGLVDSHTHLVFGGWRQHEVPLKLAGASYLDILRAGGGILSSVRATRSLTEDDLFDRSAPFLSALFSQGVTTAEIKSGYGLDLETELKQLRVIRRLGETSPAEVVPTFLGAHAVPEEFAGNGEGYTDFLINTVLPAVAKEKLAEFCDIFIEEGVFSARQGRRLLERARALGMGLKIHADEIAEIGGSALAGEMRAVSAEHLVATGPAGMDALREGGVTAVLLPATSLYLNKSYAPAREMIARGIPVAVATDFNPGSCPSLNIGLCINLAYLKYRMTPAEILTAVTLNAAAAVGRAAVCGSVEAGKRGDLVVWDAQDTETLCYRMGTNLARRVVKGGRIF